MVDILDYLPEIMTGNRLDAAMVAGKVEFPVSLKDAKEKYYDNYA